MLFLTLWSGCAAQPLQQRLANETGRIETIAEVSNGIVVGVPRGTLEPAALEFADSIRVKAEAGMVAAYGFGSKRIPVTQPLVRYTPSQQRGSTFSEFRSSLRAAAGGPIRFYIGLRVNGSRRAADRIEVAATGFSRRQLEGLKERFFWRAQKELLAEAIDLALEPLDEISWDSSGARHHGVLLAAERGLSIRLPARLADEHVKSVYRDILSDWVVDAIESVTGHVDTPEISVTMLPHGKIELIHGTGRGSGIVIGAPHGTFDAYTGGLVRRFCAGTGLAGVVATGFTPTESGDGWRINVNRPSERHATLALPEAETLRAQQTYQQFKKNVFSAARGRLELYVDIHQNSGERIEVATVGISREEARFIKAAYYELRDQALTGRKDMAVVEMAIEPLDRLEVGAWPAKESGILRLARKSLHFELPGNGMMASEEHRNLYGLVLTQLLRHIAVPLAAARPRQDTAPFTASSR